MTKILFVCHGNICRSPMAEYVMKDMVKKAGRAAQFEKQFKIESAATSTEEIGNPVYPPARQKLAEHGITCAGHAARQMSPGDYEYYDLLIGMDAYNIADLRRLVYPEDLPKIHKLPEFAGSTRDIADPWYTGNFDVTYDDILEGCTALLAALPPNENRRPN